MIVYSRLILPVHLSVNHYHFSQLEKLISLLHNWRNIPIPDEVQSGSSRSDDQSQAKPGKQASTCDAAFRTFCGNFNLFLPLEASACEQLEKLIRTVWERPIKTLFVSKYTMEVTGIMRQTVENAITSVSQVSLLNCVASFFDTKPISNLCTIRFMRQHL